MELTKAHRAALLLKFNETREAEKIARDLKHNLSQSEEEINNYEIDHFLAVERLKTIVQTLTENNIDY